MISNLFLTPSPVVLPNWQEALPDARCTAAEPLAPPPTLAPRAIVWLDDVPPTQAKTLTGRFPGVPIIALSRHPQPAEALAYLRLGCRGYCHTLSSASLLRDVHKVVQHGGLWVGPDLIQQGLRDLRSPLNEESRVWQAFTAREKQVAGCIVDGLNNKEICRHLGIEERTTKTHITSILKKAQVRDRLQLIVRLTRSQKDQPAVGNGADIGPRYDGSHRVAS